MTFRRKTLSFTLILVASSAFGHAVSSKAAAEKTALIESVRQYVLGYIETVPGYRCTLTVRHTGRRPNAVNDPSIESNVVEERVAVVDGKETVSQSPGMLAHDFGNLPGMIFAPATGADLRWARAATIDRRKVDVLSFHVPASAGYFLTDNGVSVQAPFEGLVYADAETHAVVRIQMKCTPIPDDSGIRAFSVTLDYSAAQLSGREWMLPSRFLLQALISSRDQQIYDDARYSGWALVQPR